eukprot:COSAG01_NODE_15329_length_1348_cov_4.258607_2_plen_113_part_00
MGYQLMPGLFRGVFAANQQPTVDGFCIVNTMDRPPGQHWLGLYHENGQSVLYDSFGRAAGQGDLQHFPEYSTTEPDAEQPISRDPDLQYCGQACLAFGMVCQQGGMAAARHI